MLASFFSSSLTTGRLQVAVFVLTAWLVHVGVFPFLWLAVAGCLLCACESVVLAVSCWLVVCIESAC